MTPLISDSTPPQGADSTDSRRAILKQASQQKQLLKYWCKLCVCVCVSVGECLSVYCIILQETVRLIQNFKILLHELISTSGTKGFELECGISKNIESQKSHTHTHSQS